jgi:Eukaryotic protein of unknown function (DUF842)
MADKAFEQKNAELEKAMQTMQAELEKATLRPLLRQQYVDSVKCMDDTRLEQASLRQCLERTTRLTSAAHQVVTSETNAYQQRLQRCAETCQDDARDIADQVKMEKAYYTCITNSCLEKALTGVPVMKKRIEDQIRQLKK